MLTIPTLTTARLTLRPFTPEDAPRIQPLADNKLIANNVGFIHPYTIQDAEKFFQSIADDLAKNRGFSLAITLTQSAELLGSIGFTQDARNATASFGYWIGQPFWNNGYTTEAAAALLHHLFTTLKLNRVSATHHAKNPASGRVMQKLGMTHEGTSRQNHRLDDAYLDDLHYGILCTEWLAQLHLTPV